VPAWDDRSVHGTNTTAGNTSTFYANTSPPPKPSHAVIPIHAAAAHIMVCGHPDSSSRQSHLLPPLPQTPCDCLAGEWDSTNTPTTTVSHLRASCSCSHYCSLHEPCSGNPLISLRAPLDRLVTAPFHCCSIASAAGPTTTQRCCCCCCCCCSCSCCYFLGLQPSMTSNDLQAVSSRHAISQVSHYEASKTRAAHKITLSPGRTTNARLDMSAMYVVCSHSCHKLLYS